MKRGIFRHNHPAHFSLRYIIDSTLIDVGVLVNDWDGVVDRVVIELRFVVVHIKLHLSCLLNRAAQLVVQSVRTLLEGVKGCIELFHWYT